MQRKITPGTQNFSDLRLNNSFYVDKTKFIKEWWERAINVTLITRPRRFGKTLLLDTVKTFFSPEFYRQSELFHGLDIWKYEQYRKLQGTIPVIYISFAKINNNKYEDTVERIKASLASIYGDYSPYININKIPIAERGLFTSVSESMSDARAQDSLLYLSKFLSIQHKTKPIILLDEYDTPLHAAWLHGYWDELLNFMRGFFNATFKSNTWFQRGLMTGITRVSKESIFSDMNNLAVVGTTSDLYADSFGFTEKEVFEAMEEFGLSDKKKVREWYDGFTFGSLRGVYNP